jgi:hypothetical protein
MANWLWKIVMSVEIASKEVTESATFDPNLLKKEKARAKRFVERAI